MSFKIWYFLLQVDFGLRTRWPEYTFIYLYEMFYKAEVLKNDHNFFRPVSQLKTSVIVWYLLNPVPPSQSVSHLTASQAKSIWGLTDEELESNYHDTDRGKFCLLPRLLLIIKLVLKKWTLSITSKDAMQNMFSGFLQTSTHAIICFYRVFLLSDSR